MRVLCDLFNYSKSTALAQYQFATVLSNYRNTVSSNANGTGC